MTAQAPVHGTTIEVRRNGPYQVSGSCRLRNPRGEDVPTRATFALCRCGNSSNKPFCDRTHRAIGFDESRGRQAGAFEPPLGVKRFGLVFGGLLIAGAIAAILALRAAGKGTAPGIFGRGTLFSDFNLALEILLVAGLTFGYWLAKRGNIAAHRNNQTVWVLLNSVLVVLIMAGGMENAEPGAASDFGNAQILVPWVHAVLGGATVTCGLWLVLQMNGILPQRLHVRAWKTLMRTTLVGYWLVALLGLAIYYLWFIR